MAISQAPSNYLKLMLASYLPSGWIIPKEDEAKILPASEKYIFLFRESGYLHIQGTKPDTVGKFAYEWQLSFLFLPLLHMFPVEEAEFEVSCVGQRLWSH